MWWTGMCIEWFTVFIMVFFVFFFFLSTILYYCAVGTYLSNHFLRTGGSLKLHLYFSLISSQVWSWIKNLAWKLSADWQRLKNKDALWPSCSFALRGPRSTNQQPGNCRVTGWSDGIQILIQILIIIRYKNGIMIRLSIERSFLHGVLPFSCF